MATTSHALRAIEHVPFHADPILAAIDAHDEAWSVWQMATDAALPVPITRWKAPWLACWRRLA